jgi:hypothetical protein
MVNRKVILANLVYKFIIDRFLFEAVYRFINSCFKLTYFKIQIFEILKHVSDGDTPFIEIVKLKKT